MTFENSHNQVIKAMEAYRDELDRHETYCHGLRMNLEAELNMMEPPDVTQPVEAASRLRELIGLK